MILSCQNVKKSFGEAELFKNVSFTLNENDKAALIGVNGCGKTTLLRIIVGEISCDEGVVALSSGASLAYLAQRLDIDDDISIYDYLLETKKDVLEAEIELRQLETKMHSVAGAELEVLMEKYSRLSDEFERQNGYAYKSEVVGIIKGLGFSEDDFDRKLNTLSGGQKTRVALGKTLLLEPELLILDEPTNHLDVNSIAWLESRLSNYPKAALIVSHDRYFLDRIVNKVIEIENKSSLSYSGNYTQFSQKKAQARKAALNAYIKQQREVKRQQEVIRRLRSFNREKSIKRAESREKLLEKTELLEKPAEDVTPMRFRIEPDIESGNDVLSIEELSKSFSDFKLYDSLNLELHKGERIALIGENGSGKTTLLKMIAGLSAPDSGKISFGSRVNIGYYDQEQQTLDPEKSIFEEISDSYPLLTETKIRNVCAAFLFTGDEVFTPIKNLSGGERGRVSLAKLMLSEANFLILDEPTNHLDIYSREILEEALNSYAGSVLFVSHDRYFINKTATKIVELIKGQLITYLGDYDYYIEKRDELRAAFLAPAAKGSPDIKAESDSALSWKAQKEAQAQIRRKENEIKKTEEKIAQTEALVASINAKLELPENANDHVILTELSSELEEAQDKLNELYELWERLSLS